MKRDLVIRIYPNEYGWLPYMLRSLNRYARGWGTCYIDEKYANHQELRENEFCDNVSTEIDKAVDAFTVYAGTVPTGAFTPDTVEACKWHDFPSHQGINSEVRTWMSLNGYAEYLHPSKLDGRDGMWTLVGDTHAGKWAREVGRLDHDQNSLPHILEAFKGRKVVWDVGAFIGDHTIAYANAGHDVLAIEPRTDAFECLARNMTGRSNVCSLCCAVGNREHVTFSSSDELNKGARHLIRVDAGRETMLMDDIVRLHEQPEAIKFDVEGWECKALEGAGAIIATSRPVMVLEVNRGALERAGDSAERLHGMLTQCGYKMVDLFSKEPWLNDDPRPQFDVIAEAK